MEMLNVLLFEKVAKQLEIMFEIMNLWNLPIELRQYIQLFGANPRVNNVSTSLFTRAHNIQAMDFKFNIGVDKKL